MSLILEALRRSERERSSRAGEAAAIAVPMGYGARGGRPGPSRPVLVAGLAVLLIALLALGWWLLAPTPVDESVEPTAPLASAPGRASSAGAEEERTRIHPVVPTQVPSPAPIPVAPSASTPVASPTPIPIASPAPGASVPLVAPVVPTHPEPAPAGPGPEVVDLSAQLEPALEPPKARAPAAAPTAPARAGQRSGLAAQPSPRTHPAPAVPAAAPAPERTSKVPTFAEMPAGFQDSVPALDVQVLFYSRTPERRFVLVNGRRYRPGEELMPGLVLVGVERSGMVLEWRGERFLMPAGGAR